MTQLRITETAAWDYPLGLAQMRWQAHWEQEGSIEVWNEADIRHLEFVAAEEAKAAVESEEVSCPA